MGSSRHPDAGPFYTRGELELALGRLVLGVDRLVRARTQRGGRPDASSQKAVVEFLESATRIYARTRPEHRALALERLASLAQSSGLGLVGLEEWLESGGSPYVSSDRHVATNILRDTDGIPAASSRHV